MEALEKLKVRKVQIEADFARVQGEVHQIEVKEDQLAQKKNEFNVELFRLQGEHRLIADILGEDAPVEEINKS